MQGSCNCGAVRFELTAEPSGIYACHCSICRKSTGAGSIPVLIVRTEDLVWREGQDNITCWSKPDADWKTWFCKTCGSPLPGMNDPQHMFIPAGLIDNTGPALRVIHHIWTGSKANWDEIGDQGRQHPEGFGSAPD